jgi:thioredoxin reductase (NADPH)
VSLPLLIAVEKDQGVRLDVEAQLVQRYGRDYRVQAAGDPDEALRTLTDLADAGTEVALVLIGKSLADGDLLDQVRRLHPHAKRALLVPFAAWADPGSAEAIREAMALGRIDHYVFAPGRSPDEVFHEAVSSFLLESARDRRSVPHTVHIVGEAWSGRAFELRTVFERCAAPHTFCLADSEEGRRRLSEAGPHTALPVMILPDGRVLSDPSDTEIADVAGAPADIEHDEYDLVIVGAGPAGLSAAVYGASEGLHTLVIDEGGIGGQARSSSLIRNYLGFSKGISGSRLAEQAYEQAMSFGASFVFMNRVTGLSRTGQELFLTLGDERRVRARAVILATGASYRRLGVPELEDLVGAGVFYGGPVSEAPGLTGTNAYVAGGGNSAGQAALLLARYARRVTLVVRAQSLEAGMSTYLIRAVEATPNLDVRTGTTVVGGGGTGHLEQLVLRKDSGDEEMVAADALFVLIGADPHTDWLPREIARERHGFVLTGDELLDGDEWPLERRPFVLETGMPGVFAAGDARHASVKRVASAVGEGSIAIQFVHAFLADDVQRSASPIKVA